MKKIAISFVFILALIPLNSYGRNTFLESLNKRQEVKKKTRWTLADWLATKEKIRLMDMWLAANTSEQLFEFILSYSQTEFDITNSSGAMQNPDMATYKSPEFKAFISILGVGYEQSESKEEEANYTALTVYLRILGASEQSTNLTLHYGQKSIDEDALSEIYKSTYWGGSIRIYLFSFLGIYGMYRGIQDTDLPFNISSYSGVHSEYGAFIDIGPLQIFGNVYKEDLDINDSTTQMREGAKLGASIYF